MKKLIFILFVATVLCNTVYAQKISAEKVPSAVTAAFKAKFPSATKSTWEMESKTEYEVNFKQDGKEVSANFDSNGNWLETETEIKTSGLLDVIKAALKNNFSGFKITEASLIESVKNGKCYEAEIEKGEESFDVLFSTDGKILSKTKLEEKEKRD